MIFDIIIATISLAIVSLIAWLWYDDNRYEHTTYEVDVFEYIVRTPYGEVYTYPRYIEEGTYLDTLTLIKKTGNTATKSKTKRVLKGSL